MIDKIIVALFSLMVFSALFGLAWLLCWGVYGVYLEGGMIAAIPFGMIITPVAALCATVGILYPATLIRVYFFAEGEK